VLTDNIVAFPARAMRRTPEAPVGGQQSRSRSRTLNRKVGDAAALAAIIIIPSVAITATLLGVAWAMWAHHAWLASQLGPYGQVWAWGGYALTTGAAYAWTLRRFPPAIVCAWGYVLFMVLVEGWAHVSFGPAAVTAGAGALLLRASGR
jgi:hypothetical protein